MPQDKKKNEEYDFSDIVVDEKSPKHDEYDFSDIVTDQKKKASGTVSHVPVASTSTTTSQAGSGTQPIVSAAQAGTNAAQDPELSDPSLEHFGGKTAAAVPSADQMAYENNPMLKQSFKEWAQKNGITPEQLADPNYDYHQAYEQNPTSYRGSPDEHFSDIGKTITHPTFSKESAYYKEGMDAGEWTTDPTNQYGIPRKDAKPLDVFKAGKINLENPNFAKYFKENEPNTILVLPDGQHVLGKDLSEDALKRYNIISSMNEGNYAKAYEGLKPLVDEELASDKPLDMSIIGAFHSQAMKNGKSPEVLDMYNKILGNPDIPTTDGIPSYKLGFTDEANKKFSEKPNFYGSVLVNRASANQSTGNSEQALTDINKGLQLVDTRDQDKKYLANTYIIRSHIFKSLGKDDLAAADERKAEDLRYQAEQEQEWKNFKDPENMKNLGQFWDSLEHGRGILAMINPAGHVLDATEEGLDRGVKGLAEAGSKFEQGDYLSGYTHGLKSMGDIGFSLANATPVGAAFTATTGALEPLPYVGKAVSAITAPETTFGEATGMLNENSPQWLRDMAGMADIAAMGKTMHLISKGHGAIVDVMTDKLSKGIFPTKEELTQFSEALNDIPKDKLTELKEKLTEKALANPKNTDYFADAFAKKVINGEKLTDQQQEWYDKNKELVDQRVSDLQHPEEAKKIQEEVYQHENPDEIKPEHIDEEAKKLNIEPLKEEDNAIQKSKAVSVGTHTGGDESLGGNGESEGVGGENGLQQVAGEAAPNGTSAPENSGSPEKVPSETSSGDTKKSTGEKPVLPKGVKEIFHHTELNPSDVKNRTEGTWFTSNEFGAVGAKSKKGNILSKVINPSELKLASEKEFKKLGGYSEGWEAVSKKLKEQGYDGLKRTTDGDTHYLIFDLNKLKNKSDFEVKNIPAKSAIEIAADLKKKRAEQFKKNRYQAFNSIEPETPEQRVLHHFATGGKINTIDAVRETGFKGNSAELLGKTSKTAPTIDRLVSDIMNNHETDFGPDKEGELRNQIIDILSNKSIKDVGQELLRHFPSDEDMQAKYEEFQRQQMDDHEVTKELSDNDREKIDHNDNHDDILHSFDVIDKAEIDDKHHTALVKDIEDNYTDKDGKVDWDALYEAHKKGELNLPDEANNILNERIYENSDIKGDEPNKGREANSESTGSKKTDGSTIPEGKGSGGEGKQDSGQAKGSESKGDQSVKDAFKKAADKVRSFQSNPFEGLTDADGKPIKIDFSGFSKNDILEAIAKGIEKTGDIVQSIHDAIKDMEWFKSLDKDSQEAVKTQLKDKFEKEGKTTTLRNAEVEQKRKEYGFDEPLKRTKKSNPELEAEADKTISEGYDVHELMDKIINDKHPITDLETAILNKFQGAKQDEILKLNDSIAEAASDKSNTSFDRLVQERDKVLDDLQRSYDASEASGTTTGRALQSRKLKILQDYSIANLFIRKRKANGGEKLTPEQIDSVNDHYKEITEKNKALEAKIKELEDKETNRLAQENVDKIRKEKDTERRKSKSSEDRDNKIKRIDKDIADTLENIRAQIKKQASTLSANPIPLDMFPQVAKLAKLYSEKGAVKLATIVDNIYNDLKDDFKGLTTQHIKEAIADYNNESRLKSFKKRQSLSLENYKDRLANRIFTKEFREPIKLDAEALKLQEEVRKAKSEFEKEMYKDELKNRTFWQKTKDAITEVTAIPRAIESSIDYSAVLRQGAILSKAHPVRAAQASAEMFKQGFSQKRFDKWMADLKESPQFELMDKSGLYIADPSNPKLAAREEVFMSNLAEKIPIFGESIKIKVKGKSRTVLPGLGLIKGSERAYVGYLNKLRADVFMDMADQLNAKGVDPIHNPDAYKAIAEYVNNSTGRGALKPETAKVLSWLLFSPRLIKSRLNSFNPAYYYRMPKQMRMTILADHIKFLGLTATIIGLSRINGAQVATDPSSKDLLKIKDGDTRIDDMAGLQQYVTNGTQFLESLKKTVYDHEKLPTSKTPLGIAAHFGRSKLAPSPGIAVDFLTGSNYVGEPVQGVEGIGKEAIDKFTPLISQDLRDLFKAQPPLKATFYTTLAAFGEGVQTYKQRNGGQHEGGSKPQSPIQQLQSDRRKMLKELRGK